MKLRASPLAVALGLALFAPAVLAADGVLREGAAPLANAEVRVGKLSAKTDSDGRFSLPQLKPGNFNLEIVTASGRHLDLPLHYDGTRALEVDIAGDGVESIVVAAAGLARPRLDMAAPASVLSGDALIARREATLGETLSAMPGVSSGQFGGGASRPVIRGLDGARVRVLASGVDTLDASSISPDHVSTVEPLLAERVEVLKGPATLLYGGGAIGGVVNVIDEKVPTHVPEDGIEGALELRGNSVADERAGVLGLTAGTGPFALRVEAVKRNSDDYAIPGRAAARPEPDDALPAGVLLNSHNDTDTGTLGASWVVDSGYVGVAVSEQNNAYGLPGGETEADGSGPHIALEQQRRDVRGEFSQPLPGVDHLKFGIGNTDYVHQEIESSGEVATTFTNKASEGRLELTHARVAGWRGVFGVQSLHRDFAAIGEEAYVPPTVTNNHGVFVLEEYAAGDWRYELGARHEWQDIAVDGQDLPDTRHDGTSLSAGAVWKFAQAYSLNLALSRSQRLPSAEELYAHGPHLATQSFEIGDAALQAETAHNLDISLHRSEGPFTYSLGVYRNAVSDFIYAAYTGAEQDELKEVRYTQRDATLTGVEAEASYAFDDTFSVTVFGDQVRGTLDEGGTLPRIPAARLGVRVQGDWNEWTGAVEYTDVQQETRPGAFETETNGYALLNASLGYHSYVGSQEYQLFAKVSNALDEDARNSASFLKDLAPQAGRNFTLGLRMAF